MKVLPNDEDLAKAEAAKKRLANLTTDDVVRLLLVLENVNKFRVHATTAHDARELYEVLTDE